MFWLGLFIGIAIGLGLAAVAWGLVSSYRALKAEDAARAASQRGEGDR
ncbi:MULTISPECIES: hypothetical protein [Methylobacterium]